MTLRNTARSWGAISKALHWLIVLLIINQWVIAARADALPLGAAKLQAIAWHKSFGITILALGIVRLVWRWLNPVPTLEGVTRQWERVLARVSHSLLYALIFAMPLSGWLMSSARNFPVSWFGLVQLPDLIPADRALYQRLHDLHETLFGVLVCVALLHVAGALKHHFIDRNDVLRRMLPFGGALLFAALAPLFAGRAAAADPATARYVQAPAGNQLSFTFTQLGAANTGRFKDFHTELNYDAAHPTQGSLRVRVVIGSVDTLDPERDGVLKEPDLFDEKTHPDATFVSSAFVLGPAGDLAAIGKLTLRGVSRDLRLPLRITPTAAGLDLSGQTTLRRLDFGIGQGEWQSTESVGDEVKVRYEVSLVRAL